MTDERRNLIETAQMFIARHFARLFSRSFHFASLRAHCRRDACAPSRMRAFLFHDSATQLFESPNSREGVSRRRVDWLGKSTAVPDADAVRSQKRGNEKCRGDCQLFLS